MEINNCDIPDLRVAWEALIGCAGNCTGCNIVKKSETINGGLWSDENFESAKQLTNSFFSQYKEKIGSNFKGKIFLTAGDYLGLSDENLEKVVSYVNDVLPKDLSKRTILFTASAIGKKIELEKKIEFLQKLLLKYNLECFPEIVIDFKKLNIPHYLDKYVENIKIINTAFPVAAGVAQIGYDLLDNKVSYENIMNFRKQVEIKRFEFALSPHEKNGHLITSKLEGIMEYIVGYCDYWYSNNIKNFRKENSDKPIYFDQPRIFGYKIKQFKDANISNIYDFIEYSPSSADKVSIYIKNNGDVGNFFSGLANVYPANYSANKGYTFGNIKTDKVLDIEEMIKQTYKTLFISLMKKKSCENCDYKYTCATTGNLQLIENTSIETVPNKCPLKIKDYMKKFEVEDEDNDFDCESFKTINLNFKGCNRNEEY